MSIGKVIRERLSPHQEPGENGLLYWRERILFALLACGLALTPVVIPPSLIMIFRERLWSLAVIDGLVLMGGIYLFFSRKPGYRFRALGALFLMYAVGSGVLINAGFVSGGPAWLLGFSVMAGLLLGLKAAIVSVVINLATLSVIGYGIADGMIAVSFPNIGTPARTLASLVNFLLMNAVTSISAAVMVRGLEITALRQQNSAKSLHKKIRELELSEVALKESEGKYRQAEKVSRLNESRLEAVLQLHHMTGENLSEIAGFAMEQAVHLTNSSIGYIAFLNDDETVLTMHAWSRHALEQCRILDKPIVYAVADTGLWGEAIRQRRPVITNDYSLENTWKKGIPDGHVDIRRHMNVPCFDGEKIVVLAGVGNKETDYDESDIRQLKLLMIGMWRIIQRKRAEEALRSEKERFRALLQQAPFAMLLVRETGVFVYANPKFTEIFGYDLNDVPDGKAWFNRAYPDPAYRKQVIRAWKADMDRHRCGENRPRIYDVVCKDGRKKTILFIPVRLETGENLMSCEDITERAMMEEQLRHAQKMEAIGTLAGGVAHDFNNLLQGMGGYAQILLMDKTPDDPDYAKLKGIEHSVERAAKLVRQLLLFSRKAVSERRDLDLGQETALAIRILERTIPRMIDITVHSESGLWTVQADPVQIEQVILNLGVNSADAMPEGGKLVVNIGNRIVGRVEDEQPGDIRPGKYVLLTVSDTGTGIDPETLSHIFEPFFTTKEVGKGTGLGLASVYGIVKSHGGYIQCHSELGRGTTFQLFFPAVPAKKVDTLAAVPPKTVSQNGVETILVVDDETDIRNMVSQMLERFGYTVRAAASGEEALRYHTERTNPIDLTILDLNMPGMGGNRCLQEILKIDSTARILIASGYASDNSVETALEAGATGFIAKPYQLAELVNRVREILDHTGL